MGYDVFKVYFSSTSKMLQDIIDISPDYIFTVNLSEKVSEISKVLSLPYISWTVDTPTYTLYDNLLQNKNLISFIYDYDIACGFTNKGLNNVFYMPVAANVKRLDKIDPDSEDILKYSCDVSFLGTTGYDNEFNRYIGKYLSQQIALKIKKYLENR
jgi:hypothetical protein